MRFARPNRLLLDRKAQMDFSEPWRFAALRLAQSGDAEGRSPEATSSESLTCFNWESNNASRSSPSKDILGILPRSTLAMALPYTLTLSRAWNEAVHSKRQQPDKKILSESESFFQISPLKRKNQAQGLAK